MIPKSLVRAALAVALVGATALPASAQAYDYPQFQIPRVSTIREFNFGIVGAGDAGTVLLGQWREPVGPRNQLSFDLSFGTPKDASVFGLGGQFAHQLTTASMSMPLDMALTVGAGFASLNPDGPGDNFTFVRVPVGVSLGHTFPLQGSPGMSITPYVHPRLAYQRLSAGGNSDSETAVDFDLGGDFTFNSGLSMRLSARLGGGDFMDQEAYGVSLAWRPMGMHR